jgi:hypothetical protein
VSYDVRVFAQRALGAEELRGLLAEGGLTAEPAENGVGVWTVARGARALYSFTLGLPVPVEAEDVPEEVTAVLLGPSHVYELMVEGSSAGGAQDAVRFARRLARASAGAVLDQQTGQVWAGGKLRSPPAVDRGTVDVVELRWYVQASGTGEPAARTWLDLARQHLPEAMPRRFGSWEPLSMKLDVVGPDAFVRSVAAETTSVYFKASAPCIEGSLSGGASSRDVRSHSLSVHREALRDPRWRAALQRLFVGFAAATGAVYASAEVVRGLDWSGRSIGYGSDTEHTTYLAGRGEWAGLPPYPVWWSWFGPEYTPLVLDHLAPDQVVSMGSAVFHPRGAEPLDRTELSAALPGSPGDAGTGRTVRSLFFRRAQSVPRRSWLPAALLPTVDDSDPSLYNPPLTPAVIVPDGLRPTA